jgi:hypothetical protein
MRFIEEVVVDEFLPTFRSMLAEDLRARGLTQSEVADHLGISQSAVSKYVHSEIDQNETLRDDVRIQDLVEHLGAGLASGEIRSVQALVETEVLIRQLEQGDLLAKLHREEMPELADYDSDAFDIHDQNSDLRVAERALSSVRRGVTILETTSGFASHIPAVGSNLVECIPDAEGIEDVVGVPGRILDVKGQATIPGEPEFGVSEHVARVLLAARESGSDARATLNVKYDEALLDRFVSEGYTIAEFDSEADLEPAIRAALREHPDADVLYQTGGMNIEPITYLLGADATDAANTIRKLV